MILKAITAIRERGGGKSSTHMVLWHIKSNGSEDSSGSIPLEVPVKRKADYSSVPHSAWAVAAQRRFAGP